MAKLILNIIVIILISAYVTADVDDNEVEEVQMYSGVKVYSPERECSMVGGLCVHKDDCVEFTSTKGLCPQKQSRGIECCYELPIRPAPCSQHMGACMNRCHKLLQRPATDCDNSQVCCVLI